MFGFLNDLFSSYAVTTYRFLLLIGTVPESVAFFATMTANVLQCFAVLTDMPESLAFITSSDDLVVRHLAGVYLIEFTTSIDKVFSNDFGGLQDPIADLSRPSFKDKFGVFIKFLFCDT